MNKDSCAVLFCMLSILLILSAPSGLSDSINTKAQHSISSVPLAPSPLLPNPIPSTTIQTRQQQNILPIANAGQNQVVTSGSIVRLDGGHSYDANPSGNIILYRWVQTAGTPVALTDSSSSSSSSIANGIAISSSSSISNTAYPLFIAPIVPGPSLLTFTLTVTDNYDLTSTNPSVVAILVIPTSHTSHTHNPLLNGGRGNGLNHLNPYQPNPYQPNPYQPNPYQPNPYQPNPYQPNPYQPSPPFSSLFPPPPPPATTTPTTPAPSSPNTGSQIYTPKPEGRVFTAMNPSGGNCKSDGIRFNIANEHTLVDRESTWIFTLNNNPQSCTDKPWWSPKIGSHGSTGQASGLYEASVPYSGGFKSMRTEGPHPQYHPCSGYQHASDVPPMPRGTPIGIKTAQWRIPNGVHVEFWYDFTGGGKGPWVKYASLDDTLPGHCNGDSVTGPIGIDGTLIGPAPAQDTMRMNGADATYIGGSIVELAPGQTSKGSIGGSGSSPSIISTPTQPSSILSGVSSPLSLSASSVTGSINAIEEVPLHPIANKAIFHKGLIDGQRDAQINIKTMIPTSTTTPDDVDCESPSNLSGQDSIDYCKGYENGLAGQNNMMLGK
jgi:hypothetical protein